MLLTEALCGKACLTLQHCNTASQSLSTVASGRASRRRDLHPFISPEEAEAIDGEGSASRCCSLEMLFPSEDVRLLNL